MTFNPRMVTLARESIGLTQSALAASVGISQGLLSRIENGFEVPNDAVIAALAAECQVLPSFFVQPELPSADENVDIYHRKRATMPAKPLRRAHAETNVVRFEILRLLRSVELRDVAPLPPAEGLTPEEAAAQVRAAWRMSAGPVADLTALIEAAGVPVVVMDLGHEKLPALSMPGPMVGRDMIFLNARLPASNQRFSLAHELGHLVMHASDKSDDMEREAHRFAQELLMPASDIERALVSIRFRDLGALKPIWRVSLAALIRRSRDLGAITDRQYAYLNMQLNKLPDGRKQEPGEFPAEEPRLVRGVIEYYRDELGYSIADIAALMVVEERTFRERYLGEQSRALRAVGGGVGKVYSLPVPGASGVS